MPVSKRVGDHVIGATLNSSGSLVIRAEKVKRDAEPYGIYHAVIGRRSSRHTSTLCLHAGRGDRCYAGPAAVVSADWQPRFDQVRDPEPLNALATLLPCDSGYGRSDCIPQRMAHAEGDLMRGAKAARECMACHSFEPGRNMTGPSLANVWGRKAGTAVGFARYSDALKQSGLVWDKQHLDAWLKDPSALVPGNAMEFPGIADARTRADLLAYIEAVSTGRVSAQKQDLPDLKEADAASRITAIRYCGDTYRLTTADRKTHAFWEFNLRFKTDGSVDGPRPGTPVLVGTGMHGDRAAVIFSRPEEISAFIRRQCA